MITPHMTSMTPSALWKDDMLYVVEDFVELLFFSYFGSGPCGNDAFVTKKTNCNPLVYLVTPSVCVQHLDSRNQPQERLLWIEKNNALEKVTLSQFGKFHLAPLFCV